jgi:hypothetical protein
MKNFLTLKHWQLFSLLVIIPVAFQLVMIGLSISNENPVTIILTFPVIMLFGTGLLFGWLYAVGTHLHSLLPATVSMNLRRFKLFLFIPVIYIFSMLIFITLGILQLININTFDPVIILIIVPLHLFSMFCIFYCLYFNAKAFKAVELQRPVKFNDFIGEFFLTWYFPIGIWFLQPRLNKLFDSREH